MTDMLLIVLFGAILGIALFYFLSKAWQGWRLRRRLDHGIKMEAKGEKILRQAGYHLSGIQQDMVATLYVNGEPHSYKIRPDALAQKNGTSYAVEIKSGSTAPNPLFKETRRQMLEYYFYFPVDGVLLVDADQETITLVEFEKSGIVSSGITLSKLIFLLILLGTILFLLRNNGII
jgi:hypothetical protein